MTNPPAGWYPNGDHHESWWDGARWTGHHREVGSVAPASSAAAEPPSVLTAPSFSAQRGDAGVTFTGLTKWGRFAIGGDVKTIPYGDLVTIELSAGSLRVRHNGETITLIVPPALADSARAFVAALLSQHRSATGRDIGAGGKLSRADRKVIEAQLVEDAFAERFVVVRDAVAAGDIVGEAAAECDLVQWLKSRGQKEAQERVEEAIASAREDLGFPALAPIGHVGPIYIYEDRVVNGREAHAIDALTEAQVFLDGQQQVTTRASLSMALGSFWVPGTALIGALARPKKETHDLRSAQFYIGSVGWTWGGDVPPDAVGYLRGLAQRVNAVSSSLAVNTDLVIKGESPTGVADVLAQLRQIDALVVSNVITVHQGEVLKAKLLSDS